jgi:hypothetical protein
MISYHVLSASELIDERQRIFIRLCVPAPDRLRAHNADRGMDCTVNIENFRHDSSLTCDSGFDAWQGGVVF